MPWLPQPTRGAEPAVGGAARRNRLCRLRLAALVASCLAAAAGGCASAHRQVPAPDPAAPHASRAQPVSAPGVQADGAEAAGAGAQPAHVQVIRLRHSADGLRKTYLDRLGRPKDGMQLPRIIVFNHEGRLLGGQAGFRTGDMRPLRRLVHEDNPFARAADLDDTLAELETADGSPVVSADIPEADVVLVVYRSADCERCDRLDAELSVVVAGLHRHRFAWLVVDSDPERVNSP